MATDTGYTPPFTVSARAVNLIAEISAMIERFAIRLEQSDGLRLRKANRIKTICSSLAIEGNTLDETVVSAILDGKAVVAPLREVQEVKNAIATYDLYPSLNPFKVKDLLRAHGVMMRALIDDAGRFRNSGVGVFEGNRCVHMAPPPMRVPALMGELFDWLKRSQDHLLVRSCVFHFEFEYIHPFSDGNGRMGRLWQSLILGKLNPVFEHLPVENMVHANQQQYYDAINESTRKNDSAPFIEFMLGEILKTLKEHQGAPLEGNVAEVPNNVLGKVPNKIPNKVPSKIRKNYPTIASAAWDVLSCIIVNPKASADDIGMIVGISGRMVRKHVATLREAGLLVRVGGAKGGHWEVKTRRDGDV